MSEFPMCLTPKQEAEAERFEMLQERLEDIDRIPEAGEVRIKVVKSGTLAFELPVTFLAEAHGYVMARENACYPTIIPLRAWNRMPLMPLKRSR